MKMKQEKYNRNFSFYKKFVFKKIHFIFTPFPYKLLPFLELAKKNSL